MRALWSDRPNCSHNVSQKVKRIRCFSEGYLKMAFFTARCRLDGAFPVWTALSLSRRCFPCGISLERAVRIDVSSANFRAKSHFQVRTSERNPIFRCPSLRCPPLGPPDSEGCTRGMHRWRYELAFLKRPQFWPKSPGQQQYCLWSEKTTEQKNTCTIQSQDSPGNFVHVFFLFTTKKSVPHPPKKSWLTPFNPGTIPLKCLRPVVFAILNVVHTKWYVFLSPSVHAPMWSPVDFMPFRCVAFSVVFFCRKVVPQVFHDGSCESEAMVDLLVAESPRKISHWSSKQATKFVS